MDLLVSGAYDLKRVRGNTRLPRPRVGMSLMGLRGLGGISVEAALAEYNAAQAEVSRLSGVLDFAKNGYDPKYGEQIPLNWMQLPPFIGNTLNHLDVRVRVADFAQRGLDRQDLQAIVNDPNAEQAVRFAAWFCLRVYPLFGGVSSVLGTIQRQRSDFMKGTESVAFNRDGEDAVSSWPITPAAHMDPKKIGWAFWEGKALSFVIDWTNRFGVRNRQLAVSDLQGKLDIAKTILGAKEAQLNAARLAKESKTEGGLSQDDVNRLEDEKKDAESRAKTYMMLGLVGVVAVGGFFWWKSRR